MLSQSWISMYALVTITLHLPSVLFVCIPPFRIKTLHTHKINIWPNQAPPHPKNKYFLILPLSTLFSNPPLVFVVTCFTATSTFPHRFTPKPKLLPGLMKRAPVLWVMSLLLRCYLKMWAGRLRAACETVLPCCKRRDCGWITCRVSGVLDDTDFLFQGQLK